MNPAAPKSPERTDKYKARADEVDSLASQLGSLPGDPGPVCGRLLEAAGDLIRRSKSVGSDRTTIAKTLTKIPEAGLKSWGESVNVNELSARLKRAADEAVEAAFPDTPEDHSTWHSWAMQGLQSRDRLQSALEALQVLAKQGRADAAALAKKLAEQVKPVDSKLKARALWLTPLNADRRAEAELLDDDCRGEAWWFTAESESKRDALVPTLGGEELIPLEGAVRDADLEVKKKRSRKFGFDELFRYDLGLASGAERAVIDAQAERDPEMKKILAAMQAGDEVIDGLEPKASNVTSLDSRRAAGRASEQPRVVEERGEFRVLVFRRRERVQVVVQPKQDQKFAAAAVYVRDGAAPADGRPTSEGIEFDLGKESELAGQRCRVVVKLQSGAEVKLEAEL